MFTENFEKKADAVSSLKAIGKSLLEASKGAGSGLKQVAEHSHSKLKKEWPKAQAGWRGFKAPKSYKAASEFAASMSPELAAVGAVGYGAKKLLDPNEQRGASLAYY